MINIDIEKLKEDLMNYYGTAMFSVSPLAVLELNKIEKASDEKEFLKKYKDKNDFNEYIIYSKNR